MSETLTAASRDWNPLLHPRGADGRFIEVGSWVRWLRQGFGSTRRGQVKEIIADPNAEVRDGVPTKVIARVEFPDKDGKSIIHEVPTEELEKVAPPKGSIDESESGPSDSVIPDAVEIIAQKALAQGVGHAIHDDEHGDIGEDEDDDNDLASPLYGLVISRALEVEDVEYNAGDTVTYKVVAENKGSVETGEYSFTDDIPEGLEFISATGDGTISGDSVSWTDRPSLEPGGAASVTVTAKVVDPAVLLKQKALEEKPVDGEPDELTASLMESLRSQVRGGTEPVVARATEYWTEEKRREAAASGVALPNGKYPIEDREDLRKSIAAYGRAEDPVATKRHIMRRASIIGELDLLPGDWAGSPGFDPARHLRGSDGKFISQGGKPRRSSAFVASTTAEELRGRVHRPD